MTPDDRYTTALESYLDVGPTELSDRVIWSVRSSLSTTHQRRHRLLSGLPWRTQMNSSTKLLVAAGATLALVVAVGGGLFNSFLPSTGDRPSPSQPIATQSPSASASASTSASPAARAIPVYPAQSAAPLTFAWESAGGSATKFGVPAVGPDGRIWVASSVDNAFRILAPDGTLSETWGTPGSGNGQFNFSVGTDNAGAIAFAPDGGFWVVDTGNFRVQRFDKDRKFLSQWGRFGSGDGDFSYPLDIAVDAIGTIFVGDDGRHDVQAFTSNGTFQYAIKPGQFVSANGEGWVLTNVLPDGRPGLVEYKPDGTVQGGMDMPDLMPVPMGTARDSQHNIYAVGLTRSDTASTLIRFAETGTVLGVWDAGGLAIAVSPVGDIAYVLQPDDATIRRFDLPAP